MKIKVLILDIVLKICNLFVNVFPIQKNKIAFVSLESKVLDGDLKLIYEQLEREPYNLVCVLTKFKKNSLWMNLCYFFNTIKQLMVINTSALVIINDNNYVISKYKRKGVKVLQVWHAAGAIKKFGNAIERKYFINNYDYVLCNSDYWKTAYSLAFNIDEKNVLSIGMPRLDHLLNETFIRESQISLYSRFPELKNKKIILYAPTFRGDIYTGMIKPDIDLKKILSLIDSQYVILFKLHPLLENDGYPVSERILNMNNESLHELFCISDVLVSDFSSIIFDFSLLNKPMYGYVPDLHEYMIKRGCFIEYPELMKNCFAYNEVELAQLINEAHKENVLEIRNKYLSAVDGKSVEKTIKFIKDMM